ncbi:hypothetical protein LINGRAHAP2_LOCUS18018, partial [Linum grandiflorum]
MISPDASSHLSPVDFEPLICSSSQHLTSGEDGFVTMVLVQSFDQIVLA